MDNQKYNKKRLGVLDVFIIIALLACIVSVVLRYVSVQNSSVNQGTQLENYTVSFKVYDVRESSAVKFMQTGSNFYLKDNNALIGALDEGKTVAPAKKYYEMANGETVLVSNSSTGDLYRVDVEGSFSCSGKMSADGSFLLNGNKYISVNQELKVYSKYLAVTIKVTGISKAQ